MMLKKTVYQYARTSSCLLTSMGYWSPSSQSHCSLLYTREDQLNSLTFLSLLFSSIAYCRAPDICMWLKGGSCSYAAGSGEAAEAGQRSLGWRETNNYPPCWSDQQGTCWAHLFFRTWYYCSYICKHDKRKINNYTSLLQISFFSTPLSSSAPSGSTAVVLHHLGFVQYMIEGALNVKLRPSTLTNIHAFMKCEIRRRQQ